MSRVHCSPNIFDSKDFKNILKKWGIEFETVRTDIPICGSPERTSYRMVVADSSNQLYILEMFAKDRFFHKQQISDLLDRLYERDIQSIIPYQLSLDGNHIVSYHDVYWQLISFISGIPLDRPHHVKDDWRGKASSSFLIDLWKKTETIHVPTSLCQFSLKTYVLKMGETMKTHHPDRHGQLLSVLNWLKNDFFAIYETIPNCFCHGDFHPLNMIWSDHRINAVIDWEFLGMNIEMYDMANMIGCLGIEHPSALFDGFASSFIHEIKKSERINRRSFDYLLECITAIRFAWLAEWFRKNDAEMIDLEISYINLLKENSEFIKEKWKKTIS